MIKTLKYKIFINIITIIILLCVILPGHTVAAVADRPRLYYNSLELENLKTLKDKSSHQAIWEGIKYWADSHISDMPPKSISNNWSESLLVKQYMDNMSFTYAMTKDTIYANAAKTWAIAISRLSSWADYENASIIATGMAFAYDSLSYYFTDSEKNIIKDSIIKFMSLIYNNYQVRDFKYYPNAMCAIASGLGLSALALEGDYSGTNVWLNRAIDYANAALAAGGTDGGWFEGFNYATVIEYLLQFLDALKRIKGVDLFDRDFLKQLPYYFIYGTQFKNGLGVPLSLEDTEYPLSWIFRGCFFLYLLASEYNNGYAQWYAEQAESAVLSTISDYTKSVITMYIWNNPYIQQKSPDNLPLTKYFPSLGYVITRSSWADDAYIFVFKSGSSVGHAHPDQNSWSLYGPSGLISGNPGYTGLTSYDSTANSNCILGNGLGQAQEPGDLGTAPLGTRGVIQQVNILPSYVYVRGDASATYINKTNADPRLSSGDLNKWSRSIVIMTNPFYFLIFDDVAAPKEEQFDWIFQGNGGSFTAEHNVVSLNHGTNLNATIMEPDSFTTHLVGSSTYIKYPQMRVSPSSNLETTKFLTAMFSGATLNTEKVKQGNLLGTIVDIDTMHRDLILYSVDGKPVSQWVELGGFYMADDGISYIFNGTKVLISFSTDYAVMRLAQSPVLSLIGNKTVDEGNTLSINISAVDTSGNQLNYSAQNLPQGATFDSSNHIFVWTPDFTQAGSYPDIRFIVSNGISTVYEDITIIVNKINQPPKFVEIGEQTVKLGQILNFHVSAIDPNNDTLIYKAFNLPNGAYFDPSTQDFTWKPKYFQSGVFYKVTFTVTDGIFTDSENINIRVAGIYFYLLLVIYFIVFVTLSTIILIIIKQKYSNLS